MPFIVYYTAQGTTVIHRETSGSYLYTPHTIQSTPTLPRVIRNYSCLRLKRPYREKNNSFDVGYSYKNTHIPEAIFKCVAVLVRGCITASSRETSMLQRRFIKTSGLILVLIYLVICVSDWYRKPTKPKTTSKKKKPSKQT